MNLPEVKRTIEQLINEHMPTAAVASGWASKVDISAMVNAALAEHGPDRVKAFSLARGVDEFRTLGIGNVAIYCEQHGLPTSEGFVREYRHELIKAAIRGSVEKGEPVYIHAMPR